MEKFRAKFPGNNSFFGKKMKPQENPLGEMLIKNQNFGQKSKFGLKIEIFLKCRTWDENS